MTKPVVLVTAIGTAASTTIVSQLTRSGRYHVIGADIYPKHQVATSRDVNEFFVFPAAIRDLEAYIDFVVAFCREHQVDFYFATIDEEVANLSAHRARLEEVGVRLCIPNDGLVMTCHYKDRFSDWIDANLPTIGTKRYRRFAEVAAYPVFIKPIEGRASIGCRKIEKKADAEDLLRTGLREEDYLIQEFHEGEIITVDLVRNARTGQKQQIQRIERLRNASGCGIAVEIVDLPALRDICDALMEKLQLNGVVNAEFFHQRGEAGERFWIIEVNPRFSAGTSYSCLAGCDIVANAVQIAAGEACELGVPTVGAHLAKRYETYRLDEG